MYLGGTLSLTCLVQLVCASRTYEYYTKGKGGQRLEGCHDHLAADGSYYSPTAKYQPKHVWLVADTYNADENMQRSYLHLFAMWFNDVRLSTVLQIWRASHC